MQHFLAAKFFLTINGNGGHLAIGHVTSTPFLPNFQRLQMIFDFDWPGNVSRMMILMMAGWLAGWLAGAYHH